MPKIVCTVPKARFERFGVAFPAGWDVVFTTSDELSSVINGADFLFVGSVEAVSKEMIDAASSLRMIHVEGVGYNKVDYDYAAAKSIPVCNNRATNNMAVAEHTIGLMLAGLRRSTMLDREVKAKNFASSQSAHRAGGSTELASRHVGLIGIGAIGKEVAKRLIPFGCRVSYYDAFRPTPEAEKELNVAFMPVEELIETCDIISVHVPVLPSTENMLSYAQFDAMQPSTLVVNTARGEIIDSAALADALTKGKIYGAALDTIAPEPPQDDHPLLNMPPEAMDRLTITPHIGGTTDEAFTRMLTGAIANMERMAAGQKPVNVVNGVE